MWGKNKNKWCVWLWRCVPTLAHLAPYLMQACQAKSLCLRLAQEKPGLTFGIFWPLYDGHNIANALRHTFILPSLSDLPPIVTLMRHGCICYQKNDICTGGKIAKAIAAAVHRLCTRSKTRPVMNPSTPLVWFGLSWAPFTHKLQKISRESDQDNLFTHAAIIRRLSMCNMFTHVGSSLCTLGQRWHPYIVCTQMHTHRQTHTHYKGSNLQTHTDS